MRSAHVTGLLLAAGRARRFGSDKLLTPLSDGTSIAVAALRALRAGVDEVVAVVRSRSAIAPLLLREGARLAVAAEVEMGMGASIAAGVGAADVNSGSCLIALADMPFVLPETIMVLAERLRSGASILAPEYRGARGHPVGFSRQWFRELRLLRGDTGARELLAQHHDVLQCVSLADPGVLADIDRPSDLEPIRSSAFSGRC